MRIFEHFNPSYGATCPVCKTAADRPTVLVPIPGTERDNLCEARQVHKKCFDLVTEMDGAETPHVPAEKTYSLGKKHGN